MERDVYFFSQPCPRNGRPRRSQKFQDDLPDDLKYSSLNPRVSAYLSRKRTSVQLSDVSSTSLLPEIKQAVSLLKRQLDGLFGENADIQNLLIEEAKLTAFDLLSRLQRHLDMIVETKPLLPMSLVRELMSGWNELIINAQYTVREWQSTSNKEAYACSTRVVASDVQTADAGQKVLHKPVVFAADMDKHRATGKDLYSARSGHRSTMSLSSRPNLLGIAEDEEQKDGSSLHHKDGSILKSKFHTQMSICSSQPASVISGQKPVRSFIRNPESKGLSNQAGYWTQIQFQLSSKACKDKGWIVDSMQTESEFTVEIMLKQIVERLRVAMKEKNEQTEDFDYSDMFHFYGDSLREPTVKSKRFGLKTLNDLKPRIPPLTIPIGKNLFKLSMVDGSNFVYYPSGHLALTRTCAGNSSSIHPAFYTVAYDEDDSRRMLASFTPSGKGCCYHDNGLSCFLATETGFMVMDRDGRVTEKLEWPASGAKLSNPVTLELNSKLTLRCSGQQSMHLIYHCQKQLTKFYVGVMQGAEKSPSKEELGCLLSGLEFQSKTAYNFSGLQYLRLLKHKSKPTARQKKLSKNDDITDVTSSVENSISDKDSGVVHKDSGVVRLKLEIKIKSLVEDWMGYYRVTLGIVPVGDDNKKYVSEHDVQSTRSSPIFRTIMENMDPLIPSSYSPPSIRLLSAPVGLLPSLADHGQHSWLRRCPTAGQLSHSIKFSEKLTEEFQDSYSFGLGIAAAGSFNRKVSSNKLQRMIQSIDRDSLGPLLSLCPAMIRSAMLNKSSPAKTCPHRCLPHITDLEYDQFIQNFVPENQLIVISVSSLFVEPTANCRNMLENLYERQNKNRAWPCFQSRNDPYRVFLYDITMADDQCEYAEPLLVRRHNVVGGMFLMYKAGRLVFCDRIFNGYSTDEKNFLKQLNISNTLADKGHSLPNNFRFSPQANTGNISMENVTVRYSSSSKAERLHRDRIVNEVISIFRISDSGRLMNHHSQNQPT